MLILASLTPIAMSWQHHSCRRVFAGDKIRYTILNDLAVASRVVQADGTAESAGKKVQCPTLALWCWSADKHCNGYTKSTEFNCAVISRSGSRESMCLERSFSELIRVSSAFSCPSSAVVLQPHFHPLFPVLQALLRAKTFALLSLHGVGAM